MTTDIAIVTAFSLAANIYFAIMLRRTRGLLGSAYARRNVALQDQQRLRDENDQLRDDLTRMRDDRDRARDDLEAATAQLDESNRLWEQMTYGGIGNGGAIVPRHAKSALSPPEPEPEPDPQPLPEPTPLRPNGHRSVKDFRAWPPSHTGEN
jgi:hypothetical protein